MSIIIEWFGHSCFKISDMETSIVTDPFSEIGYPTRQIEADYVMVSHSHYDHSNLDLVKGYKEVFNTPEKKSFGKNEIFGVETFHDDDKGKQRGKNIIFRLEMNLTSFVHLGDLGQFLTNAQVKKLRPVDVLFIPVGGIYTINAEKAFHVIEHIQPKIVIPMHYKTPHLNFDLGFVDDFLKLFQPYQIQHVHTDTWNLEFFDSSPTVIVMDYKQ